jgi:very-short-patch-repair endonuclease
MRYKPTFAERLLWARLCGKQTGYKFRRQAVILGWIADFYCPQAALIVEVDGHKHNTPEGIERDSHREKAMWEHGFFTLRVENESILEELDDVVSWIIKQIENRIKKFSRKQRKKP